MKNLLYKEFNLSVHPLTYLFVALMALSGLSPVFPTFVPLLYFTACYTFLFIGMNKTTTTNDLLYTCMLPIKREGVVKARVFSTTILQLIELVLVFLFFAINRFIFVKNMSSDDLKEIAWITLDQGIVLAGVYFICFGIYDLIYMPWFYKNGKSIIANMFVGMLVTIIIGAALTIIPHFVGESIITVKGGNLILQFGLLLAAIGFWICSKVLVIKISTKNLVNLDF